MITVFLRGKGKVYEGNHIKRWTKKKKKKPSPAVTEEDEE